MSNDRKAIIAANNAKFEAAYAALPAEKKTAEAASAASQKFNRFMSKKSASRATALLGQ